MKDILSLRIDQVDMLIERQKLCYWSKQNLFFFSKCL